MPDVAEYQYRGPYPLSSGEGFFHIWWPRHSQSLSFFGVELVHPQLAARVNHSPEHGLVVELLTPCHQQEVRQDPEDDTCYCWYCGAEGSGFVPWWWEVDSRDSLTERLLAYLECWAVDPLTATVAAASWHDRLQQLHPLLQDAQKFLRNPHLPEETP